MISYDAIENEVLNNLDVDFADTASAKRFDTENKINEAYRRLVRDFPTARLIESGIYESQNFLTSGIHVMPKDHYLRIIDVFLDYDGSFKDNVKHGRKATEKARFPDMFVGALETQPTYELRNNASFVMDLNVEPKPSLEVTDGLTLFAVINDTFDSANPINLDYSLRGALVYLATSICAMVDYYNVDLAGLMLNSYNGILQESMGKVITNEG